MSNQAPQRTTSGSPPLLERREIPSLPELERGLKSLPAWAVSLLLHVTIITALGVFWVGTPKGTGDSGDRPVGIAVVYEMAGKEEYAIDGGAAAAMASVDAALDSLPSQDAAGAGMPSTEQLLSDLLPGTAAVSGDPSDAAGALGLGEGGGALGANREIPKAKTTVFGIEGEGTRFLYVFDRSDSMNGYGGAPLRAAKQELIKSLQSLAPVHQFQIIFYNDSPLPFGGLSGAGPRLLTGETQSKVAAERFVRDVIADGGTRHLDALRMALGIGPDVVFFLTDADSGLPANEIENLQLRASRSGATIHAIQFGAGPNQSDGGWIRRLSNGTGGQYRYIDVTQLEATPQ
ncbi:MAG: hypothetical protein NXI32_19365 [bacterium]|nr:hypothetical protein [bacterium]